MADMGKATIKAIALMDTLSAMDRLKDKPETEQISAIIRDLCVELDLFNMMNWIASHGLDASGHSPKSRIIAEDKFPDDFGDTLEKSTVPEDRCFS